MRNHNENKALYLCCGIPAISNLTSTLLFVLKSYGSTFNRLLIFNFATNFILNIFAILVQEPAAEVFTPFLTKGLTT